MSEEDDWDFAGADDAKITIRAAVRFLLKGAAGSDRGDILIEIMETVRQAALGEQATEFDPLMTRLVGSPTPPPR
jgi:hypothetical protein